MIATDKGRRTAAACLLLIGGLLAGGPVLAQTFSSCPLPQAWGNRSPEH